MSKFSVSEKGPGPSVSDTSSRCVQPSSTTYSTYSQEMMGRKAASRRNSSTTLSRPSSPTPPAHQDDHLAALGANTDLLFLSSASPGQDVPYHNIHQDKINLKHALEDLARQPTKGHTNGHADGDGHNSNKRTKRDDLSSPGKGAVTVTHRRNGLKDVEGSSVKDAKARKTS
ncbi:unnamed protein product [Clonostachys rosea]|uniref:Uncharacterized protein n=1 Tax=Bionectria ochroleuca TaxID=29856 RepID=A0ABY6U1H0_BIOOC|nr:unnamed protein product [Clonostachys rosea]